MDTNVLTNVAIQLPVVAAFVFFVIYLFREFKELIANISADYKDTLKMIMDACSEKEDRHLEAMSGLQRAIERLENSYRK